MVSLNILCTADVIIVKVCIWLYLCLNAKQNHYTPSYRDCMYTKQRYVKCLLDSTDLKNKSLRVLWNDSC